MSLCGLQTPFTTNFKFDQGEGVCMHGIAVEKRVCIAMGWDGMEGECVWWRYIVWAL